MIEKPAGAEYQNLTIGWKPAGIQVLLQESRCEVSQFLMSFSDELHFSYKQLL